MKSTKIRKTDDEAQAVAAFATRFPSLKIEYAVDGFVMQRRIPR